jgi:glycerophosphoryl diester phosphodiesterase
VIALERGEGRPLRIGHRGAAALAPENTLASFRAALAAGVDLIELDVVSLSDGRLLVAHSPEEATPESPTLEEAFRFFVEEAPDVGVHLDLKGPAAAAGVLEELRRFGLLERAFASSFHVRTLRALARLEPRLRIGITFPRSVLGLDDRGRVARAGLPVLRPLLPALAGRLLAATRAHDLVLQHRVVSNAAVRAAHDRGAAVVAWTVDDPDDLARVVEAGVDAVVTDDPRIFASTLHT